METKNRLTVNTGEGGKDGKKGSSQGTCVNDPWERTTGWGLTVGAGVGLGGGEQGEKIEITVNKQ